MTLQLAAPVMLTGQNGRQEELTGRRFESNSINFHHNISLFLATRGLATFLYAKLSVIRLKPSSNWNN